MRIRVMSKPARVRSAAGWGGPAAARRGALVAWAAVALAAWGGWLPASASASGRAPAAPLNDEFRYVGPGIEQTVIVPAGASSAEVRVVGGKGGSTVPAGNITGGDGARVTGRISVSPGQLLRMKVAGAGFDVEASSVSPGAGGWGATGYGGHGGRSSEGFGAGGGGASSLAIGDATVVLAGGGGGAGGAGFSSLFDRGGPGGSSGRTVDPGHDGKGAGEGRGGGGGGNGMPPGGNGGDGNYRGGGGGGGGAGSTGGAGGGGGGFGGGGGGGGGAGSSYHSHQLEGPSVVRGSTSDDNGLITITWNQVIAPVSCSALRVHIPIDSPAEPVRLHCTATSGPVRFRIDAPPAHGHLRKLELRKGIFSYEPDTGYTGTDSVLFQALSGGQASAPYVVTFAVRGSPAPMRSSGPSVPAAIGAYG
jgi:hypothetical protein